MKVYAMSGDKKYWRIGNSSDTKDWYVKTDAVASILDTTNKGDEVTITWEKEQGNNQKFLTAIKIIKRANVGSNNENSKFRHPEELRRDETMRSACLAIQAMPGSFADVNALITATCLLYDKLLEKTK